MSKVTDFVTVWQLPDTRVVAVEPGLPKRLLKARRSVRSEQDVVTKPDAQRH
jgi:hypothetical protein